MSPKNAQKLQDITLALAGIFQAAALLNHLTKTGLANEAAYAATISSIYKIDAVSVIDVFGSVDGVKIGLQELVNLLCYDKARIDPNMARYVISLMYLERKLKKNYDMLNYLKQQIHYVASQTTYFTQTHPNVIANLASIYLKTLGRLPFRIRVVGQAKFLNQPEILNQVRALLLAGVRSVVLWRQIGGSRLQLLCWRHKLINKAKEILASL